MGEEKEKKKRHSLSIVTRRSTKKIMGAWRRLESADKEEGECDSQPEMPLRPVLGVPLETSIRADPSLDGVPLPAAFRQALDYVEAHGLDAEGIYRVSSPKSRLDEVEREANACGRLELCGPERTIHFQDPHEAAGLLKRYLRQLPEALLPPDFEALAERCECDWKGVCGCGATERAADLLQRVPRSTRYLVAYVFLHAQNVVAHEHSNKMGVPALGLLLQTVLEMSRKLVCLLIANASGRYGRQPGATYLFDDIDIKPYVSPRSPLECEAWQCDDVELIGREADKQQRLLDQIHIQASILRDCGHAASADKLEEKAWRVQTALTQLRRRTKHAVEPTPLQNGEPSCPTDQLCEEKQLMAVAARLREDCAEEERSIARLCWLLGDRVRVEKGEEEEEEDEWRWRELSGREEERRSRLVGEVGELRRECALLRAMIEWRGMAADGAAGKSTRF